MERVKSFSWKKRDRKRRSSQGWDLTVIALRSGGGRGMCKFMGGGGAGLPYKIQCSDLKN